MSRLFLNVQLIYIIDQNLQKDAKPIDLPLDIAFSVHPSFRPSHTGYDSLFAERLSLLGALVCYATFFFGDI